MNLTAILKKALASHQPAAQAKALRSDKVLDRACLVEGDPGRLEQIASNLQLIRAVRALPVEQGGATLAAAITAFARSEDLLRALQTGYQMHLAKPVDQAALLVAIANLTLADRPTARAPHGPGAFEPSERLANDSK